jgi:hypothetical protein
MNTKQVADLVTFGRAAGALALAGSGLAERPAPLSCAAAFMIADWSGDMLDGALARRCPQARRTWIGDHDLEVDMWVAACLLAYLALAGYVDLGLAAAYAVGSVIVLVATNWPRSLSMLCQAPIYGALIVTAMAEAPAAASWLVLWVAAAILLTWPRFPREVVPGFVDGMRNLWQRGPGSSRKV